MIGVGRGDHTAVTLATAEVEFRHEALLYAGSAAFLDGTLRFIGEGLSANEPMLVAVSPAKIESLRQNLGTDADRVCFANMHEIGANPARIIPVWRDFLEDDGSNGRRVRGIGEPIWDGRTSDELVECQRHEALLNVAFAGQPAWRLMCPYDTMTLPPDVIDEAQRSHPFIVEGRVERDSPYCRDLASMAAPFDVPLPAPSEFEELTFDADSLGGFRRLVSRRAMDAGLGMTRAGGLAFSVHELAANSVRHGGGHAPCASGKSATRCCAKSRTVEFSTNRSPDADGRRERSRQDAGCGWSTSSVTSSRSARSAKGASYGCTCIAIRLRLIVEELRDQVDQRREDHGSEEERHQRLMQDGSSHAARRDVRV